MNFASSIFIYVFMPAFLMLYLFVTLLSNHIGFIKKFRVADITIILFSLLFYMWACFDNVFFLILLILATWLIGKFISKIKSKSIGQIVKAGIELIAGQPFTKIIIIIAVVAVVTLLYQLKYKGEITFKLFSIKDMATPLGISFLVFSVISYIVDVYKGAPAGNLIDTALYLGFFPKVISGPIVLWENFSVKLNERKFTLENMESGVLRIIYGLAKKVMLADYFGSIISKIQTNNLQFGGGGYRN